MHHNGGAVARDTAVAGEQVLTKAWGCTALLNADRRSPDKPLLRAEDAKARRRRLLLAAAAVGVVLLVAVATVAGVLGSRARSAPAADQKPARPPQPPPPPPLPANITWSILLNPSGSTGLPRATARVGPAAAPAAAAGNATSGAGAGEFAIQVQQPISDKLQAWRAQLRSEPLRLSPLRAYSLVFEARSGSANASVRVVLQSVKGDAPVGTREVQLARDWAQRSLMLVQPPPDAGQDAAFSFQARCHAFGVQCGSQEGTHEFRSLRILEEPVDNEAVSPDAVAARTAAHRAAPLRLEVAGPGGGPAAVDGLNLTLRRHHFVFGTAIEPQVVRERYGAEVYSKYIDTLGANFWSITPENAFKWHNYEPQRGQYQEGAALLRSDYFAVAEALGIDFLRGHTLEWGEPYNDWKKGKASLPFWPFAANDCSKYFQALKEHVVRDVRQFRGKFTTYDVLNEVIEMPSMLRACGLATPEAISQIFQWAHEADPTAILCLNEWAVLEGSNWQGLVELARGMLDARAPLHCIGVQAHLTVNRSTPAMMWRRLNKIASLGLPVYITELTLATMWDPVQGPISGLSEEEQSEALSRLVALFFSHPRVAGVTLWGFFDGHVWVRNSGIFRADFSPKPAAVQLRRFWSETHNTTVRDAAVSPAALRPLGAAAANGQAAGGSSSFEWTGYFGRYSYELSSGGKRYSGTFDLHPGDGGRAARVVLE